MLTRSGTGTLNSYNFLMISSLLYAFCMMYWVFFHQERSEDMIVPSNFVCSTCSMFLLFRVNLVLNLWFLVKLKIMNLVFSSFNFIFLASSLIASEKGIAQNEGMLR